MAGSPSGSGEGLDVVASSEGRALDLRRIQRVARQGFPDIRQDGFRRRQGVFLRLREGLFGVLIGLCSRLLLLGVLRCSRALSGIQGSIHCRLRGRRGGIGFQEGGPFLLSD